MSGNKLFIVLLIPGNGTVAEYDATTGAPINATFITGVEPTFTALALLGNTLFVSNALGTVGEYDATTRAPINTSFITGLTDASGIAVKSAK